MDIDDYKMEQKRKKSKKRKGKRKSNVAAVVVLVLIILLLVTFGAFYYFFINQILLKGSWVRRIDIKSEVAQSMNDYLHEATFGDEIDANDYLDSMFINITLTLDGSGFEEKISEEDYNQAVLTANEALKRALSDLIVRRLEISDVTTDKDVDALVTEAIGMSLDDYLLEYGPQLLCEFDYYDQLYSCSGKYKADRNKIYLDADSDGVADNGGYNILVSDNSLMIIEENEDKVYARENENVDEVYPEEEEK